MQREIVREESVEGLEERRRQSHSTILMSERLVLRKPGLEDIDALAHLANNHKVASMVSRMPHPYTAADGEAFVKRVKDGGIGKAVFAITRASDGQFMGCCGIERADKAANSAEIGYWLGEPYWNNGYATEAAQVLVDLAFNEQKLVSIDARCRVVNSASRRVIQKCGFQYQGTGMAPSLALGGSLPVEWYRLDRATWESLRSWGGSR
jgi:RimJ/RimL family protein N-acetyltransferase